MEGAAGRWAAGEVTLISHAKAPSRKDLRSLCAFA